MANDTAVLTKNLIKKFGNVTALDGIDLEIKKGEFFGIFGPDGAGKTTLIKILAGILPFGSGEAYSWEKI